MPDNYPQFTEGRDHLGRFAKGNPGRPAGVKNKSPRALLNQIQAMEPAAVQKLWEHLCMGERWAIEFIFSKILPSDRSIEFGGLTPHDIQYALQNGDISPNEGKVFTSIIKNMKEIENLDEIKDRLDKLEEAIKE